MSGGTHNGPDRCIHGQPTRKKCDFCAKEATYVTDIPQCDICGEDDKREAQYDGKTVHGPWAYMCGGHFRTYGVGLGLGRGQRLVKRP
jgi:hypothetical protein